METEKKFVFNKDNCFIISIDKENNTRLEKMKKRMSNLNIEFTHKKACLPKDLNINIVNYLSPGERASTQSHVELWRKIVDNNLDYALILEDDACFRHDFLEKLNNFWVHVKDDDWHMILLNASEEEKVQEHFVQCREQFMVAGYILHNRGARWLLGTYGHEFQMSDWMTTRMQLFTRCYTYFPWLIIQEGADSTVQMGEKFMADCAKVRRLLKEADYPIENYS